MSFKRVLKIVKSVNMKVCYIAVASIFIMMCMTTINTILRKASIGGIVDAFDMTGLLMILIVFCSMAYQESEKGHIRVEMFVDMLPKIAGTIVGTLLDFLTIFALSYLSYAYFIDISKTQRSGASTQNLMIPEWPFEAIVAVAVALFALTVLLNTIDRFMPQDDEAEPADKAENTPAES